MIFATPLLYILASDSWNRFKKDKKKNSDAIFVTINGKFFNSKRIICWTIIVLFINLIWSMNVNILYYRINRLHKNSTLDKTWVSPFSSRSYYELYSLYYSVIHKSKLHSQKLVKVYSRTSQKWIGSTFELCCNPSYREKLLPRYT